MMGVEALAETVLPDSAVTKACVFRTDVPAKGRNVATTVVVEAAVNATTARFALTASAQVAPVEGSPGRGAAMAPI